MDFSGITDSRSPIVSAYDALGVTRYHTKSRIPGQTLAEHQGKAGVLVMLIWPNARPQVTQYAIIHDMEEHITGDLPYPAKSVIPKPAMDALDKLGQDYTKNFLGLAVKVTAVEKMMVKVCDYLELMLYCDQFRSRQATRIGVKGAELIGVYGKDIDSEDGVLLYRALESILPEIETLAIRTALSLSILKLQGIHG